MWFIHSFHSFIYSCLLGDPMTHYKQLNTIQKRLRTLWDPALRRALATAPGENRVLASFRNRETAINDCSALPIRSAIRSAETGIPDTDLDQSKTGQFRTKWSRVFRAPVEHTGQPSSTPKRKLFRPMRNVYDNRFKNIMPSSILISLKEPINFMGTCPAMVASLNTRQKLDPAHRF